MSAFHEILFPLDVSLRGRGGPERRTEIITLGSNREARNARWAHSRRRYEAGYGIKTLTQLMAIIEFFEERRGKLHGFRWRDRLDHASCAPNASVSPFDQEIGTGDGSRNTFQLCKNYGGSFARYSRVIAKPVAGSVRIAVNSQERTTGVSVDTITGMVHFASDVIPPSGATITAGFLFDTPVRFDTDYLEIDIDGFAVGDIPKIPVIEITT
jgi:uncharacterized protein (TIGR02217 family)